MVEAAPPTFFWRDIVFSLICWSLIAGPFGVLIAGIWHIAQSRRSRLPPFDIDEWFSGAPIDNRLVHVDATCEALRDHRYNFEAAEPLVAFTDCMTTGSQQERLAALRAIGTDYGPDFAPALRAATLNADAAVRVMAATVMASQKKRFSDRIAALELQVRVDPHNPKHSLCLAAVQLQYASAGLLDSELALDQIKKTRALLMECTTVDDVSSRHLDQLLATVHAAENRHAATT